MLNNCKAVLTSKLQLTSDVYLYRFKLADPPTLSFIPGQYLILFVPQEGKEPARRLYSVASANSINTEFELLIKLIPGGCASEYLVKLPLNNEVLFQGPAGMFSLRESTRDKIGLVTGTGYAPVRSMLLSSKFHPPAGGPNSKFTLFIGFPYYKDVFLLDELKNYELTSLESFRFFVCLSREQNLDMIPEEDRKYFLLGRVTNGLEQLISTNFNQFQQISSFDFYLCSGREVVESLKEYLYEKGAPKEQVYFEKF